MKLLICTQAVDKNHPILGFFHQWIEEFAQHFDEVHVICLIKGEYVLPANVHVYSLGKEDGENRLKYAFRFYTYFTKVFFGVKVDYVFYHMGSIYNILGAPFFFLRTFYKTKFYWWKTHGTINAMGKFALWFTDRVYTASAESFPVKTVKKFVVGHAVETRTQVQRRTPQNEVPLVLFVGRVTPVKKLELLIEALAFLLARGIEVRLRIVGVLPDAAYEAKLRAFITELHMEAHIVFAGPVFHERLREEFQQADVVVNPSETGSIDKVVLEAMSEGVPVIAHEDAYRDLLGQFGMCVTKQDPMQYAEKIGYVLTHAQEVEALSPQFQKLVSEKHSLSTITKRIFSI